MDNTRILERISTKQHGTFEVSQYSLNGLTLFAVQDMKPENNLWSSICYILKFNNYSVAIDPGFTGIDKAKELMVFLGIGECDTALTHGHFDHSCGLMLSEGSVFIHGRDSKYVEGLSVNPEENKGLAHKLAITKWEPKLKYDFIRNQEQLKSLRERTVLLNGEQGCTPGKIPVAYWNDAGHTLGHVIYYFEGIAFAGDVLVEGDDEKRPWYIDFMFGKGDKDCERSLKQVREDCKKSLNMLINNMHVKYVALGHGGILPVEEFRTIAGGVQ